jgi:hypothetical protein
MTCPRSYETGGGPEGGGDLKICRDDLSQKAEKCNVSVWHHCGECT